MKRIFVAVTCAVVLLASSHFGEAAEKSAVGKKVDEFTLKDYRGKTWKLSDVSGSKLTVIAVLGTECPLVKLYGSRLAKLATQYKSKGVAFVGINPNSQDSVTEIAAYAQRHRIEFPILKDLGNKVADRIGAARTPEVFVLDEKSVIRYHGRIDDQYGVGYVRDAPRRRDLQIAIDELLAGKKVSRAETKAVGCIIGRVLEANKDSRVTYSKQIARILQNRCVECHRKGEIAPFALTKYDEVAGWAEMIAEVVDQGRMPPWHASPKYGKFANDRRLSDKEKNLIFEWVKNGAPRGNPADLPNPKSFVTGWQLPTKPDAVINVQPQPYRVQATGAVRYKYFIAETGFKEDKWVKAAQILPGNRAVVHHILAFAVSRNARDELRELRGGAGGFLFGYVPGQIANVYSDGMAKKIPAGSRLVFQVHYTPIGTEQFDQSKLGLVFADPKEVKYEIKTRSAYNRLIFIQPNKAGQEFQANSRPLPPDSLLLGFLAHMHLRGQAFRYEALLPDGKKEILLDIPQYDFNWQTDYRLARPRKLPEGTRIQVTGWYDNTEDNLSNPDPSRWVRWGDQTWDEMLIGYYGYAVPLDRKESKSPKKQRRKVGGSKFDVERFFRILDKNGDGKIVRNEITKRLRNGFDRADLDGNGEITLDELRRAFAGRRE